MRKYFSIVYFLALIFAPCAGAQTEFAGAPDPKRGVFIKLAAPLDDVRGFCVDIPGHLQGVRLDAPLVVHTCKDGFWNYDERFDGAAFQQNGRLIMPAFSLCLTAEQIEAGAALVLAACFGEDAGQIWAHADGQLRLSARPELCLTVADTESEVSIGTRNHPVRHLVRPLLLAACAPEMSELQSWTFTPPSARPGVRYPDGEIRG